MAAFRLRPAGCGLPLQRRAGLRFWRGHVGGTVHRPAQCACAAHSVHPHAADHHSDPRAVFLCAQRRHVLRGVRRDRRLSCAQLRRGAARVDSLQHRRGHHRQRAGRGAIRTAPVSGVQQKARLTVRPAGLCFALRRRSALPGLCRAGLRHLHQPRHALFGGRVGAEQLGDAAAVQGVENHHLRRGRMRLGGLKRHAARVSLDFLQSRGQRGRIARDFGAATIGLELASAGNCHLDQARSQRGQNGHGNAGDGIRRSTFGVSSTEEHREVRQRRNGPGHGGGNGGNQNVAVLHMRQFMRHHPAQLTRAEYPQDARSGRHRRVLRVAAGGEGVGRVFLDEIDPRHGQPGALRKLLHHGVELGRAAGVDLLRVVHLQHHLVAEPVAEEVHAQREQQRQNHAFLSAQHGADDHEQRGDRSHQDCGFQDIEHASLRYVWIQQR